MCVPAVHLNAHFLHFQLCFFFLLDPWVGGRAKKKVKKGKGAPKKQSTQDKISELLEMKSSAHKKVRFDIIVTLSLGLLPLIHVLSPFLVFLAHRSFIRTF